MKALILTDIHDDEDAAKSAVAVEKPDLVLDCGDHHRITNLFDFTPHFYIYGNHVPEVLHITDESLPFPIKLTSGLVYDFSCGKEHIRIAGLDGHYSMRYPKNAVKHCDVEDLSYIPEEGLDVFLVHESPLNAHSENYNKTLAPRVVREIDRIKPKSVFAGHANFYNENETVGGVKIIEVENIGRGYGILTVIEGNFEFERKRAVFSNGKRKS